MPPPPTPQPAARRLPRQQRRSQSRAVLKPSEHYEMLRAKRLEKVSSLEEMRCPEMVAVDKVEGIDEELMGREELASEIDGWYV